MHIPLVILLLLGLDGGDKPLMEGFSPAVVVVVALIIMQVISRLTQAKVEKEQQVQIVRLEKKAEDEPDKVRPAWDLARATLEKYFQRNLYQVRMIFYVAVSVMIVGFGFVLWGVHTSVSYPEHVRVAIIASASGVITQFIGLTFMTIYRSTMLQAAQYMTILERINTVGMAVQILDSMKDEAGELKDTTRVDIIRLLLASPTARLSFTPRKRKDVKDSGA
jgi:hypothetical protein